MTTDQQPNRIPPAPAHDAEANGGAAPAANLTDRDTSGRQRPPAGLLFRGTVYGGSGYADGNIGVLSGLLREGIPVQLAPIGPQSDAKEILAPDLRAQLQTLHSARVDLDRSMYYQCCPAIDFDTSLEARVKVGRTTFETDRLPDGWVERCKKMDQIWVPSVFNKTVFAEAGVPDAQIVAMPEGLDTRVFHPGVEPLALPGLRTFSFLSVFDWIDRKGGDILLRAYLTEFKPDEDVCLVIKVHKFDDPGAMLEARLLYFIEKTLHLRLQETPPLLVISGLLPAHDMPRLYNCCDAFVLPSRGEGWGRPYMEAAACGKIVVAPNWGGQIDFLNDSNAYLIDIEGVVPVPIDSDREVYIGHRWSEPSVAHLRQIMRSIFTNRDAAKQKAAQARRDMETRWDWRVLAPLWGNAVRALLD